MPSRSIRTELEIDATPTRVRDAFTDFQKVNQWQSWLQVKSHTSAATIKPDDKLSITLTAEGASPFAIQPQVVTNSPDEFRWRGKLFSSNWWFVGEHYFKFESLPGKKTRLVHGEEFNGLLVGLLGGTIDKAQVEFNKFNAGLKKQVEGSK